MMRLWRLVAVAVALVVVSQGVLLSAQARDPAADYAHAEALVRGRQWDEGLQVLMRVLAAEPRNLKALNLAGIASAAKGDATAANSYFERALAVDAHFLPALRNLSISEFNAQQYAAAEKHLLVAQEQAPGDAVVNLYLGQIAYGQRNYKLAAERLERANGLIAHYPAAEAELAVSYLREGRKAEALATVGELTPGALDARLQVELGVALAENDCNAQAVAYLQAAFDRNQDSYDVGFDLALAYVRVTNYADAIKTIGEVRGRGHDSSELENLLGEALAGQGELTQAIAAYRKAISLDPKDEANYLDFASLCIDQKAFEDGMKVVTLGLHFHPESEQLTFMRGILHASEGKVDLAEQDFQQAAKLAPERDLGAAGLGAVYLQRGDVEEAIKVVRHQLSERPEDASLLYLLGKALMNSGAEPGEPAYDEARRAFEQSVKLNPGLCLPHVSLGSIYLRDGRYAEAAAQLETARAIDPNENSAYSHLAVAYRHLDQPEKSKEVLTALQKLLEQQRTGARAKTVASSPVKPE